MNYKIINAETKQGIMITDDFNHAFKMLYLFNDNEDGEKFEIVKTFD